MFLYLLTHVLTFDMTAERASEAPDAKGEKKNNISLVGSILCLPETEMQAEEEMSPATETPR